MHGCQGQDVRARILIDAERQFAERSCTLRSTREIKPEHAKTAFAQAHKHSGRLDIIVNNAGYTLVGTIEEAAGHKQTLYLNLCILARYNKI